MEATKMKEPNKLPFDNHLVFENNVCFLTTSLPRFLSFLSKTLEFLAEFKKQSIKNIKK